MNEHIGSSFDSWLKDKNIEINEDEVKERLNAYKKLYTDNITDVGGIVFFEICQGINETDEEYRKRILQYMKEESEVEE